MCLKTGYDPQNIFSQILSGNLPCEKLYENKYNLAFMDAFPQSKGHTLVIPKECTQNIFDITPKSLEVLILDVQKLAKAIHTALNPDGLRIQQFNGHEAGQTVFHFHFHIIPSYKEQTPGMHGNLSKKPPADQIKSVAEKIRRALPVFTPQGRKL